MCRLFSEADAALWVQETRALRLNGFSTSVRLEAFFWNVIEDIAARDGLSVNRLLSRLYDEKAQAGRDIDNFTSFLRVCCGRYLALRAQGLVPEVGALAALDVDRILHAERDTPLPARRTSPAA
ncbi:ribbon-helix-helix domain-containing protein [Xanthobacter autotrophicus]|uniref:ribbon-helix-helix domain-containing protein n=1 Tax=Xanthobacter autotrophicus TaxID=280 RepID=UPI0037281C7C